MTARGLAHRTLCVLFVAVTGLAYLAAGSPAGTRGFRYIAVHLVLSTCMLFAWATSQTASAIEHRWTLVSGLVARLLLIACPSFTSVDVIRYLWDGRSVLVGIDPYRVSPQSAPPELYAGWPFPGVGVQLATLYPPGAQCLFALGALFGPEGAWWAWKSLLVAASSATVLVSDRLLDRLSRRRHLPMVALSPLLVLEAGVGAHVDTFATLALVAALYAWRQGRAGIAGTLLGLGGLVKLSPLLAAPPLFLSGNRRERARLIRTALGVFGGMHLMAICAGYRPPGSLLAFAKSWQFGSPAFSVTELVGGEPVARAFSALVATIGVIAGGRLGASGRWLSGVLVTFVCLFVASPVVFPWYLLPLVPLLAARPSAPAIAWVLAHPLTYVVIDAPDAGGAWAAVPWTAWVTVLAAALAQGLRAWSRRTQRRNVRRADAALQRDSANAPCVATAAVRATTPAASSGAA